MKYTRRACLAISYIVSFICTGLVLGDGQATAPTAISVPVRSEWLGDDGTWSPVSIRVGTPPQWVNVFVSTASEETWVIGPGGGCVGNKECETKRGGIFHSNESSTWNETGLYALGLDPELGFGGNGDYGFDSIALSDQISVSSQTVGVINTTEYWLGFMGLGITPTNFSNGATPANFTNGVAPGNISSADQKTFLSSLVETVGLIPSHSYGYTAGAYYRLKHVPSSLTLGGYDANRFESHNVSFDLDPNLDPVVALNEITVTAAPLSNSNVSTGWANNSTTLLGPADVALYTIDSSTPYLWLPESVCSRFEKAFGLVYDENVQLYTFNNDLTQHDTLVNWNLTFNFAIADLPGSSSNSISLTLPYAAFDLQLTYPFPGLNATQFSPATKYFPLRKAANDTQYIIGRAFLQETYLVVDYERNSFSVYQATFAADASTNTKLFDIKRPSNSSFTGPKTSSNHGLGKGAKIGIAVGAGVAVLCLIGIFICCCCVRRRRAASTTDEKKEDEDAKADGKLTRRLRNWILGTPKPDRPTEIDGKTLDLHEAPADSGIVELPTTSPIELPGSAVEISPYEAAERKYRMNAIYPADHNPTKPVELQNRSSTEGFYGPKNNPELESEPSPRLLPPYSADHIGRRSTQTTGVSSRSMRTSRESSNLSSPMLISPLTPNHRSPTMPLMSHIARRDQWVLRSEGEDSDISDQDTAYGFEHPDTPRSNPGDRPRHSSHSPQPSPRSFSWEERR